MAVAGQTAVDCACTCTYPAPMANDVASPPAPPASKALTLTCHCQSLRQAARRATALYDTAMASFGLRISQFSILVRLQQLGPSSLQTLAAVLVLDRTTLGRNLRALERDGLVASEAAPGDRRVRLLVLTAAGRALLLRARPAWDAAQASFEGQVGAEAAAALRVELHRVVVAMQAPEQAGLELAPED